MKLIASMRRPCAAFAAATLALLFLPPSHAQMDSGAHCTGGIGGGYGWIGGTDGKYFDGGPSFQATGGLAPSRAFSVSATFLFDAAHIDRQYLPDNTGGRVRYYTVTADLAYHIDARQRRVSPYVLAGFGWLRRDAAFTAASANPVLYPGTFATPGQMVSSNSGVFDLGAGIDFPLSGGRSGPKLFTEARYFQGLAVNNHTRMIPWMVGIRW